MTRRPPSKKKTHNGVDMSTPLLLFEELLLGAVVVLVLGEQHSPPSFAQTKHRVLVFLATKLLPHVTTPPKVPASAHAGQSSHPHGPRR